MAVLAFAGINPGNVGLPRVTVNNTDANKWTIGTAATSDNNAGSAMCVDCHLSNPSAQVMIGAALAPTSKWGSHWVTRNFADTNTGGGYVGSKTGVRNGREYEHIGAWASAGLSRYASVAANVISNTTTTGGQMICESCHSIIRNVGADKLLAAAVPQGQSTLCVGCHGDMRQVINNEPSFYANDNTGNHHHRNYQSAEIAVYAGSVAPGTYDMSMINLADYGPPSRLWAVNEGILRGLNRAANYTQNTNDNGIKTAPFTAGMIVVTATNTLNCMNCHQAHNAYSGTGALILVTADNAQVTWGRQANPASKATGGAGNLLVKQATAGDPSNAANRLIQDDRKLCSGCHTGYGQ